MSSAAKLRFAGRATAVAASAALVITSFGPTAFAFTSPGSPTGAETAGAASIGLVDTDKSAEGTQGATIVTPGGTGQAMGDVHFVIPATWEAGDSYTFTLTPETVAGGAASAAGRVSFNSTPAVTFDAQAYAGDTHIADYSPTYSATGTAKTSSEAAGSVEAGKLTKYAPNGTSATTALTPDFSVTLSSSGGANFNDVVTIRFNNTSDPLSNTAKFVGTLRGKVDVGTAVSGDIQLTAAAVDGPGVGAGANVPVFMGDGATAPKNVTVPATVSQASLEVANGSVVADGTDQYVGPLTVTAAEGQTLTGGVATTLAGASFNTAVPVTATSYDAAGKVVETLTLKVGTGLAAQSLTATLTKAASKVVFTGAAVQAPSTTQKLTYTLSAAGGLSVPTGPLGPAAVHQLDIEAPEAVTVTQATASAIPTRLGGQDRYQTAVKIAEWELGTDENGPRGESDNVVIASGEGFADALSAGYLAVTKNAQLILTRQGQLPQTDVEFLKTYGAKNIFIVGGYGSVSKAVEDQLKSMQSYDVQSTVTSTSEVKTYGLTFDRPTNGFSLSTSQLTGILDSADADQGPITVTLTRQLGGNVASAADVALTGAGAADWTVAAVNVPAGQAGTVTLENSDGKQVTLNVPAASTGGTATSTFNTTSFNAVQTTQTTATPGVAGDASTAQGDARKVVPLQANLTVTRLAGADRFETNKKVNMYAAATATNPVGTTVPEYGKPARKTAILANGMAPWDALAAGPLVGNQADDARFPIPVILTRGEDTMTQFAADQIGQLDIKHLLFVGGKGVLPDALASESTGRGVSVNRLGGDTRWATAKAISDFAMKDATVSATNAAPGFGFSDYVFAPFLANGGSLDGNMSSAVARNAWADALAVGPTAARTHRIVALTDSESLPQDTKDLLSTNAAALNPVIALGLGGAVSTTVVNQANAAVAD